MAIKVTFQILMFALAFAIFTTHQAWGEQDCHDEKEDVPPVRLSLSARLISRGTLFFSHSKSATAGL
jgi:hypothetical protein